MDKKSLSGYLRGVLLLLYNTLYSLLFPLLRWLQFFIPKLRTGFRLRRSVRGVKPWLDHQQKSQPVWFHCASGEYEYAKPVIRQLKQNNPNQAILVTYFSPSIEPALAKATDVDFYCPTPWDKPGLWKEFIEHHEPRCLIIARTDLWPAMLKTTQKCKIPRLLFAKTVNSKKSGISIFLGRILMRRLTDIFCVSKEDSDLLFEQIRPYSKIHNAGDPRYDQCLHRLQHPRPLKPLNNFNKTIFIAGSTWPLDEDTLLPSLISLKKEISFIIAPHEPSPAHLNSLAKKLNRAGLKFQWYSETQTWDPDAVLIVDQVGILADLYTWASLSFVGGSMGRSVHSVLESLASGNLTFVGPKHHNNREALTFQDQEVNGTAPVQVIRDSEELLSRLQKLSKAWGRSEQDLLQNQVRQRTGASEIVCRWIENNQRDWT